MRRYALILMVFLMAGCMGDDLTRLSIRNDTSTPIYALPYASDFTEGKWIPPGTFNDFYSIGCETLDAYAYFSLYYDSLIIYMKESDDRPIKFYRDGTTSNYDPTLNPFTNPKVWNERKYSRYMSGSTFNTLEEKNIFEHYFCIDPGYIKSLNDTVVRDLNPAP